MKTLIIYQSGKNSTKIFAEEIARRVQRIYGCVSVKSLEETTPADIHSCDLLFLGGKTAGKYIFGQKPDAEWTEFIRRMPGTNGKKTVLFTTYDVATGNMFKHMKKHVLPKGYNVIGSMKSSNGKFDYFSASVLKYALHEHKVPHERSIKLLAEVS